VGVSVGTALCDVAAGIKDDSVGEVVCAFMIGIACVGISVDVSV